MKTKTKTFQQLQEQAFRLATLADPLWKSPRANRILAIYEKLGEKYVIYNTKCV